MRITLGDLKNSRAPSVVGACANDPRFLALANEALERLMYEGHWHNSTIRFRFCAVDSCITLPPQVASIEAVAVCGVPITIRTQWFEFNPNGSGIRSGRINSNNSGCCGGGLGGFGFGASNAGGEAIFRGNFPAFSDIQNGANKKFNLICDLATDVGKRVLVSYFDSNQNWVRTSQNGAIADGEVLLLAQGSGVSTTNNISSLAGVQFLDDRDGQCWGYELNVDTNTKRMIANYQAFERIPDYPRYFFPQILTGATSTGTCQQTLVDSIVKLTYVPVKGDTDLLCIPCVPAIKDMMQSLNSAEHEPDALKRPGIIAGGLATALNTLNKQAQHFVGDGAVISMVVSGAAFADGMPIEQLL